MDNKPDFEAIQTQIDKMVSRTGGNSNHCRVLEWDYKGLIKRRNYCLILGSDDMIFSFAGNL